MLERFMGNAKLRRPYFFHFTRAHLAKYVAFLGRFCRAPVPLSVAVVSAENRPSRRIGIASLLFSKAWFQYPCRNLTVLFALMK
jgi:hypothetical protein